MMVSFSKSFLKSAFSLALTMFPVVGNGANLEGYEIDESHTSVDFKVDHLKISSVTGKFKTVSGKVLLDEKKMTNSSVTAEVDVNSINTGNEDRDKHLKSEDFFDAAKYPKLTLKSTKVEAAGKKYKMIADLTLHGKTLPTPFEVEYKGKISAFGKTRVAFVVKGKINRKDFGMNFHKVVNSNLVVGDDVEINILVEATKDEPAKAETEAPKKK